MIFVTLNVVENLVAWSWEASTATTLGLPDRHVDGRPCQAAPLGRFQALQHLRNWVLEKK